MERFVQKGKNVYDKQYDEILCTVEDEDSCKKVVTRLNELEKQSMTMTDTVVGLQHELTKYHDKYEAILQLIDTLIKENQQLAFLHYPEPEDEYINQYNSRANELERLKEMILDGK